MRIILLFISIGLTAACSGATGPNNSNVKPTANASQASALPVYTYEVVNSYPHDKDAFTQGLFFYNGFLYESTGEKGHSSLRKVEIQSGKVLQKFDLPKDEFAEGIALFDGKIYQITWQEGHARVFDVNDFKLLKEFSYPGEGWGITTDGTDLFMTDGTHVMRVLDPETFKSKRMIVVMQENGRPLMRLNELEYIKGEIWANVWHSEEQSVLGHPNYIARIDPANGKLLGWIDLAGISPDDQPKTDDPYDPKSENTLNGIAYDAENDRIFVTGKKWKKIYEIKVTPKQPK